MFPAGATLCPRPAPSPPDTHPRSSSDSSTSFSSSSNSILRRGTRGGPAGQRDSAPPVLTLPPPAVPPFPSPSRPRGGDSTLTPRRAVRESPRRRSASPRAAHARPSPRAPRPRAPRSQLRRRLPGWHLRAGSAAPQAPGLTLHPASLGPPLPLPDRRRLVPGSLRLSAERSTIAKLGHGCETGRRAVFVGEEPGTRQRSHFCVQALTRADPEEELLPPRGAARAGMCCGERRRGNGRGDGGRTGRRKGQTTPESESASPPCRTPGPQIPACLASGRVSRGGRPAPNKIINRNHFRLISKWNSPISFLPLLRGPAARAAAVSPSGQGVEGC